MKPWLTPDLPYLVPSVISLLPAITDLLASSKVRYEGGPVGHVPSVKYDP